MATYEEECCQVCKVEPWVPTNFNFLGIDPSTSHIYAKQTPRPSELVVWLMQHIEFHRLVVSRRCVERKISPSCTERRPDHLPQKLITLYDGSWSSIPQTLIEIYQRNPTSRETGRQNRGSKKQTHKPGGRGGGDITSSLEVIINYYT